ncbi:hypothetical protein A2U01_0008824 [Trifolium medium]|uniref:Uncharacterized protein n=1 Tax=Trifolium medium TaxID=97028 RepID=A0A392ML71_9FABA|nr:hypothetical protein [Trifolium medium]
MYLPYRYTPFVVTGLIQHQPLPHPLVLSVGISPGFPGSLILLEANRFMYTSSSRTLADSTRVI